MVESKAIHEMPTMHDPYQRTPQKMALKAIKKLLINVRVVYFINDFVQKCCLQDGKNFTSSSFSSGLFALWSDGGTVLGRSTGRSCPYFL